MKRFCLFLLFISPSALACDILNAGYDSCLNLETKKSSPVTEYSQNNRIEDNRVDLNDAPIQLNINGRIRNTVGTTSIKKKLKSSPKE